jgi:hypothetical protein
MCELSNVEQMRAPEGEGMQRFQRHLLDTRHDQDAPPHQPQSKAGEEHAAEPMGTQRERHLPPRPGMSSVGMVAINQRRAGGTEKVSKLKTPTKRLKKLGSRVESRVKYTQPCAGSFGCVAISSIRPTASKVALPPVRNRIASAVENVRNNRGGKRCQQREAEQEIDDAKQRRREQQPDAVIFAAAAQQGARHPDRRPVEREIDQRQQRDHEDDAQRRGRAPKASAKPFD